MAGGLSCGKFPSDLLDATGACALLVLECDFDLTLADAVWVVPEQCVVLTEPEATLLHAYGAEEAACFFHSDHWFIRSTIDLVTKEELLDHQGLRRSGAGSEKQCGEDGEAEIHERIQSPPSSGASTLRDFRWFMRGPRGGDSYSLPLGGRGSEESEGTGVVAEGEEFGVGASGSITCGIEPSGGSPEGSMTGSGAVDSPLGSTG